MDHFHYRKGELHCENVPAAAVARAAGTPCYVYSKATLLDHYERFVAAFAALHPLVCFSIKSCANVSICRLLAEQGAGMDLVSGGELHRALLAGAKAADCVYAGVGKTDAEIEQALKAGVGWLNVESEAEFENISRIARTLNIRCRAALRINPDVDPKTHRYTTTGKKESKFGVDIERARAFFQRYGRDEHCSLRGIHLHLGSPIYSAEPYVQAIRKILALMDDLAVIPADPSVIPADPSVIPAQAGIQSGRTGRPVDSRLRGNDGEGAHGEGGAHDNGITIEMLDLGGGFGADYTTDQSPLAGDYAAHIVPLLEERVKKGLKIILEPGRTIVANAGVLLLTVQYVKTSGDKTFAICDGGMNVLLRPCHYDAFHFIWPAKVEPQFVPQRRDKQMPMDGLVPVDVVGPICETGDFLALDRPLPPVQRGDLLAVFTAGAYGSVMASRYNSMPLPAEVLIDGESITLIRARETHDDLTAHEMHPAALE